MSDRIVKISASKRYGAVIFAQRKIARLLELPDQRKRRNAEKFENHWRRQAVAFEAHINRLRDERAAREPTQCAAD